MLVTLIDSVDKVAEHVERGNDEHEKSGGAWLDPAVAFYIKWRVNRMVREQYLGHEGLTFDG